MVQGETIEMRMSRLSWHGPVAEFSHRNGNARNALAEPLRLDYVDMVAAVRERSDARVLIITGSDGSFCSGGDINAMQQRLRSPDPEAASPQATRRRIDHAQGWLRTLRELDVPIIAAVDGPAFGAGFCLALQADFILASDRASFCLSFVKVGCLPDFGAFHTLPRWVGMARAKELMITGRRIGALEAKAMGMLSEVHPASELHAQAHAFAERLARGPREAMALIRRLLNQSYESDYATLANLEAAAQAICMATPAHREAVGRFVSGQPPLYDWDRPTQAPD